MNGSEARTVLVTAAGTATAVNVINRLVQIPGIRIVTTDTNPRHLIAAPARWNTTHYQVPPATDAVAFVAKLAELCDREGVDAIYPIHDAEIFAVSEHGERLPSRVNRPRVTAESVWRTIDKWLNFEICRNMHLPVPETILGSALRPTDVESARRLIGKPRQGVGSVGVRIVTRFEELASDTDLSDSVIYQHVCEGLEYTIDAISQDDCFFSVARQRLETKAGVCTKARVFVDQKINTLARRVASVFGLSGLFCFQVIGDIVSGELKIIDINPRCGGGTALSAAAGFPLYELHFASMLGLDSASTFRQACETRVAEGGEAIVCRYYEEVVTSKS